MSLDTFLHAESASLLSADLDLDLAFTAATALGVDKPLSLLFYQERWDSLEKKCYFEIKEPRKYSERCSIINLETLVFWRTQLPVSQLTDKSLSKHLVVSYGTLPWIQGIQR